MTYRLFVRPEAQEEVAEAVRWYEARQRGLGREFLRAFRTTTGRLRDNPFLFQLVADQARRALIRRFPYSIFDEVHGQDVIVLACFHQDRDPADWQRRIGHASGMRGRTRDHSSAGR